MGLGQEGERRRRGQGYFRTRTPFRGVANLWAVINYLKPIVLGGTGHMELVSTEIQHIRCVCCIRVMHVYFIAGVVDVTDPNAAFTASRHDAILSVGVLPTIHKGRSSKRGCGKNTGETFNEKSVAAAVKYGGCWRRTRNAPTPVVLVKQPPQRYTARPRNLAHIMALDRISAVSGSAGILDGTLLPGRTNVGDQDQGISWYLLFSTTMPYSALLAALCFDLELPDETISSKRMRCICGKQCIPSTDMPVSPRGRFLTHDVVGIGQVTSALTIVAI